MNLIVLLWNKLKKTHKTHVSVNVLSMLSMLFSVMVPKTIKKKTQKTRSGNVFSISYKECFERI